MSSFMNALIFMKQQTFKITSQDNLYPDSYAVATHPKPSDTKQLLNPNVLYSAILHTYFKADTEKRYILVDK